MKLTRRILAASAIAAMALLPLADGATAKGGGGQKCNGPGIKVCINL